VEHDGHVFRHALGRESDRCGHRIDQVDPIPLELPRRRLYRLEIPLDIADVEDDLLALLESQLPETLP